MSDGDQKESVKMKMKMMKTTIAGQRDLLRLESTTPPMTTTMTTTMKRRTRRDWKLYEWQRGRLAGWRSRR